MNHLKVAKHLKEVAVYYQNGKDFPFSVTDFQHSLLGLHKCLVEDDFTIANISFEIHLPDIKSASILSKEKLINCTRKENGYYSFNLDLDEPYIIVKFELQ